MSEQEMLMTREEAIAIIDGYLVETGQMGGNDYEPSELLRLIAAVKDGSKSPQEAVTLAYRIRNAKQEYH